MAIPSVWRTHLEIAGGRPNIILAGAVLLGAVLAGATASLLPYALLAAATGGFLWLLWLLRRWPSAALLTVAVSVILPRYLVDIQGLSVTAERVAVPVVAVVLLLLLTPRKEGLRLGWSHLGLAVFIAANVLGSLFNAPNAGESLRLTLLIAIASLPFWLLPNIARDYRLVRFGFFVLVALGALEALFGLVVMALYYLTGLNLGMQGDVLTGAVVPYGTMWEGNIFGSFVGAALVAALGWSLASSSGSGRSWAIRLAILIMALALVVSLSRGAWLGALAGTAVVLMFAGWRKVGAMAAVGAALFITLMLLQLAFPWEFGGLPVISRTSTISALLQGQLDGNTSERFYTYELALDHWEEQPLIGWGAGSFSQFFLYRSQSLPAWVGNLELHALHDSGAIGLLGLMLVMLGTVPGLVRAICRTLPEDQAQRGVLVGLLGACMTLLIAFQATEATWLGYTWYIFGLAWTTVSIMKKLQTGSEAAQTCEEVGKCL